MTDQTDTTPRSPHANRHGDAQQSSERTTIGGHQNGDESGAGQGEADGEHSGKRQNGFTPISAEFGESLVEVRNLKTYYEDDGLLSNTPVKAVDGVTLDVERGETLGLVGESGCGKTTLGRTLAGYESPTSGTVRFDGRDVTSLDGARARRWRRHCQLVFQDPDSSLNERMTVGEIIEEPLEVHDWADAETRRARATCLIERVGLQRDHYYRYPHQFSGGQRQRIAIARALALEPEFLVLDEPTSALDVSVQAQILGLLRDLQDEFGLTYLFIAHDLAVIRNVCDRVSVMYLGNILEVGPTRDLFEHPANPYTKALLSAIPEPDPSADWNPAGLHGTPPNPRHPPEGCPFATRCPEKIRPNAYHMDESAWERVDAFHSVLRNRAFQAESLSARVRRLLGQSTRSDLEEVYTELFDDVALDDDVQRELDAVNNIYRRDGARVALEKFVDAFGSRCDTDPPEAYALASGHHSRCHHHDEDSASRDEQDSRSGLSNPGGQGCNSGGRENPDEKREPHRRDEKREGYRGDENGRRG